MAARAGWWLWCRVERKEGRKESFACIHCFPSSALLWSTEACSLSSRQIKVAERISCIARPVLCARKRKVRLRGKGISTTRGMDKIGSVVRSRGFHRLRERSARVRKRRKEEDVPFESPRTGRSPEHRDLKRTRPVGPRTDHGAARTPVPSNRPRQTAAPHLPHTPNSAGILRRRLVRASLQAHTQARTMDGRTRLPRRHRRGTERHVRREERSRTSEGACGCGER